MKEKYNKDCLRKQTILEFGLALMAVLALSSVTQAATGDLVGSVTFSQDCGVGVGIAFDGTNLWYSCTGTVNDLFKADPKTGTVLASYDINPNGGLGAIAYDKSRNAIWAGWDDGSGNVRLIQLDASMNVVSSAIKFNAPEAISFSIDDGLALDGVDDTLYISGDVASTIHHYKTDGTHIGSFAKAPGVACGNSGLAIGGNLLFEGFNGCSQVQVVDKTVPGTVVFGFSTKVAGDPNFRDEDLECDINTFAPVEVMWSKEAFSPMRAHAFEIPKGTCGVGGQPAAPKGSISGMKFNDLNGNGVNDAEPGLANWTITLTNESGGVVTNITDASGNYNFTGLPDGNYTVGEVLQNGWIQTAPTNDTYLVNITGSAAVSGKDFGNFQFGSVSGTKFEDLNANGVKDPGEVGLAGWDITITGKDTIENVQVTETTTTDANGNYNFTGLTAGTYTVSETPKAGWVQTAPATGTYTVTITSGAVVTGQDFGNFHKGKITGGGWINITGDPKATFGIVGQYPDSSNTAQGNVEYQDHIANLNIKSIQINTVATTLDKKKGVITGLAQVNGAGSYPFVVYVEDNGEPGKGVDVFNISLPTYPYSNGATLSGGNIQIHS